MLLDVWDICEIPKRRTFAKMPHVAATKKKESIHSTTKSSERCKDGGDGPQIIADTQTVAGKPNDKKPLHASMEQLKMQGATNASRRAAGSNWNKALETIKPTAVTQISTNHAQDAKGDNNEGNAENAAPANMQSKAARLRQKRKAAQRNKYVALDCEMVGVGLNGQEDMLARVSIVNKQGEVLLDKFVKPRETVVDYRTSISGIRPHDIENGEDFSIVQDEVVNLLQGKILIGHGIRSDLAVLQIKHPYGNIRDTSRYKPLCRLVANGRTPSLKRVCQAILGVEIQTGEHNSVEDARAAMNIYNRLGRDWENYIQKHQHRGGK